MITADQVRRIRQRGCEADDLADVVLSLVEILAPAAYEEGMKKTRGEIESENYLRQWVKKQRRIDAVAKAERERIEQEEAANAVT